MSEVMTNISRIARRFVAQQSFTDSITVVIGGVPYRVRPQVDLVSEPGNAIVTIEVNVPGFGWISTGFGRHSQ